MVFVIFVPEMKILQLCKKNPYPPRDGESIAILSLTRAFSSLGHDVTVLAMNTAKHYFEPGNIPAELKAMADFHFVDVDIALRPHRAFLNLFSEESYNIKRFVSEKFRLELIKILMKENYDMVQLEGLYLSPYIETIRRYSKALVVMRAHNIEHEIWQRLAENEANGIKSKYLQLLSNRLKEYELSKINDYDAVVPISSKDAAMIRELGCRKPVHLSPFGVEEDFISANAGMPHKIFFLGALDWKPNRDGLLCFIEEVWKSVLSQAAHPELLEFHVAGRNAPANMTAIKMRQYFFEGEVEDASEFMKDKGMMVVPLFSGSGMRIKIIEAMAKGKVVISTTIGAEGVEYTDGKDMLIADTAEAFAKQLFRCLQDKALYDTISLQAQNTIRAKYLNADIAGSLLGFYKGLLGKTAVGSGSS